MSSGSICSGHRRETADVDEQDRDLDAACHRGRIPIVRGRLRRAGVANRRMMLGLLVAQPLLLERCVEPGSEKDGVDRFGEVVLGTQLEAPDDVVETLERRRDDDGDVAERAILLDLGEHLEPVHLGHLDVEEH